MRKPNKNRIDWWLVLSLSSIAVLSFILGYHWRGESKHTIKVVKQYVEVPKIIKVEKIISRCSTAQMADLLNAGAASAKCYAE